MLTSGLWAELQLRPRKRHLHYCKRVVSVLLQTNKSIRLHLLVRHSLFSSVKTHCSPHNWMSLSGSLCRLRMHVTQRIISFHRKLQCAQCLGSVIGIVWFVGSDPRMSVTSKFRIAAPTLRLMLCTPKATVKAKYPCGVKDGDTK